MIRSIIFTLLLLPLMVLSLGPKVIVRGYIDGKAVLNQGLITCENCPAVTFNTTDAAVNALTLVTGAKKNTYAIKGSTGKYFMVPGRNDPFIVEWGLKPFEWLFTPINDNGFYTISDGPTTPPGTSKCWINTGGSPSSYQEVIFDNCPGTLPSAWVVLNAN